MKKTLLTLLGIVLLMSSCKDNDKSNKETLSSTSETTLYFGGDIITMEGEEAQYAEAVVRKGDHIVFVGSLEAAKSQFQNAAPYDLKGATMLPAFLDGHGHLYLVGITSMFANILPPPDGPGADFNSIVETLNEFKDLEEGKWVLNKFGWIIGNGYDDSQLTEKDHPKASDLDKVSKEYPVIIMHQSGHLASINTIGLELMGWTSKDTPNPKEGKLRRNMDGTPNGVLEENAVFTTLGKVLGNTDDEVNAKAVHLGQLQYAQNGYLTAQEGRSAPSQVNGIIKEANAGNLYIDVVSYPDMRMKGAYDLFKGDYYNHEHTYKNNFRLGGVKLTLDGSPQGKTAWLTQHYHTPPQGENSDYLGFPILDDEAANQSVADAFENKWQLLCHTNGDAAIDQYLNAVEKAQVKYNYDNHRTVIIHGQTIRKDQIERAAKLNIDASLFPMHTFYWGDWHVESVLGHPRADYISPTKDAITAGLNITSHHDAPVTFPNAMRVLDATVNRVTRSGKILGPEQRLSPFDGLKTLTIWAAYQYFEEDKKGTITTNKYADFVILDKNPIKIDPLEIHNIKIIEAIRRGKSVYKHNN
ncbi:amidohydrolase [Gaetbulibacter aquiaggeris]|uniref:Amidohydrolase n=1 Tax=Gaetbulibacter aquiaggeris TaxID=1735373 RepID=A0ABW7MKH7_9FLAO